MLSRICAVMNVLMNVIIVILCHRDVYVVVSEQNGYKQSVDALLGLVVL